MRTFHTAFGLLAAVSAFAQTQLDLTPMVKLMQEGSYGEVIRECQHLRKTAYGKNYYIDYLIGQAACRVDSFQRSAQWLDHVRKRHSAGSYHPHFRDHLDKAIALCASGQCTDLLVPVERSASTPTGLGLLALGMKPPGRTGVREVDKLGTRVRNRICDRCITQPIPSTTIRRLPDLAPWPFSERVKARDGLRARLGNAFQVDTSGHFVLILEASVREHDRQVIATKLHRTFHYYQRIFGSTEPGFVIQVAALRNPEVYRQLADTLHAIEVPEFSMGYSSPDDLSLLAIATPERFGTVLHELFHLIIRADAGDLPPWLEEGVASLYESCLFKGDSLHGNKNLRDHRLLVLDDATYFNDDSLRVGTLKELISRDWEQFDGKIGESVCQNLVNYALAKQFALYLEDSLKLVPMVLAFKDSTVIESNGLPKIRSDQEIIEAVMNKPLDQVQTDFERWFQLTHGFSIVSERGHTHRKKWKVDMRLPHIRFGPSNSQEQRQEVR